MRPQDLPIETKLIQLAEEASELSHACLKMVRSIYGDTPVSEHEAVQHVLEEMADVFVCAMVLNPDRMAIESIARQKIRRWEDRLNGKDAGCA